MKKRFMRRALAGAVTVALATTAAQADIVSEWASVKPPPAPQLKPVALDAKTTALLIMDMMKANCSARPRCVAAVPAVKQLQDRARAAGVMVWYSIVGGDKMTPADMIDKGLSPRDGEWALTSGPDKFFGTDLEDKLKKRGIKTVVICGTSFQGVGIGTGSALAVRGYNVFLPIDCLASEDAYREQYAAWHFYKGGPAVVVSHATLTRGDMLKF